MNNPKCPYCGGEMKFSYGYDGYMNGHYWYRCDNCNALAPEANSPEEAYAAAMKRERARGEWVHGREIGRQFLGDAIIGIVYEDWHCSDCGCVVEITNKPTYRYCPNCGAEMRKEKDDE